MKPFSPQIRRFAVLSFAAALFSAVWAQEPSPTAPPAESAAPPAQDSDTGILPLAAPGPQPVVFIVPVERDVDPVLDMMINRAIRDARGQDADAIILDMNTFGGRLDAATRIRDRLVTLEIPTYTYVNPKAISAGALIALATDRIVMSKGSNIGAALPVQVGSGGMTAADEKIISVMASEMRKTAKAKGHPPDIAEAFSNPDFELPGLKEKGDILTLDYDRAVELGLAAYTAASMEDLLVAEGLRGARIERFEETPTDRFARFLVSPAVMGILMAIGVAGIFIEMKTPGVGLPGAVGIAALGIYFFGSYLAHLSGYMEIISFVLGVALVAVEIFVIPGFGVAGVSGILLMVGALFFALFNMAPEGFDFNFRRIEGPLWTMTISMLSTLPVIWLAGYILPKTPFYSQLTLAPPAPTLAGSGQPATAEGAAPSEAPAAPASPERGQRGRTITQLRPAGKAIIEGRRVDVVSEGEFVDAGAEVEIVSVQGARIAVRPVK